MNYNYKEIDEIRNKYACKGELIFRTAILQLLQSGMEIINKEYEQITLEINQKHDEYDKEGKISFIGRNFELSIIDCAYELSGINAMDLLAYIQNQKRNYQIFN